MKSLVIAAMLGTVALGGIATAQVATSTARPARADANADGRVTRTEFVRQAETRFAKLDVNADGALTRDEVSVGRRHGGRRAGYGAVGQDGTAPRQGEGMRGAGRRGGGMLRQDADGDGRVSRAEHDAQTAAMFARMDTNGDGTVAATELATLPGGGRMAQRVDTDGNGALTRAEFTAQAAQRFARMDTNGDAVIDAAELQARPMGRGGQRRAAPVAAPTPPAPTGA